MTLLKAVASCGVRFLILCLAIVSLQFPARWLRPHFYPDGLPGVAVLLILMAVLAVATIVTLSWVIVPFQAYSESLKEEIRQLKAQTNKS